MVNSGLQSLSNPAELQVRQRRTTLDTVRCAVLRRERLQLRRIWRRLQQRYHSAHLRRYRRTLPSCGAVRNSRVHRRLEICRRKWYKVYGQPTRRDCLQHLHRNQ